MDNIEKNDHLKAASIKVLFKGVVKMRNVDFWREILVQYNDKHAILLSIICSFVQITFTTHSLLYNVGILSLG